MSANVTTPYNQQDWNNLSQPGYNDTTNPRLLSGLVVLVLLILNLLGNTVVCYIYQFRVKTNVFSFFVTTLAALDIITALTTMIMDVIMKTRPIDENLLDLKSLCKVSHFQVYTTSLISGCVLTLIAYQRYRKICHPLKQGMNMKTAKFALLIIVLFCALINSCTLIINGPQDVQVEVGNSVVNVTICRYDKAIEQRFQTAFSLVLVSAFSLVLCSTVVFYFLVAKSLQKFERRNSRVSVHSPVSLDIENLNKEQGYSDDSSERRRRQCQPQFYQVRMSVISSSAGSERISTQMYRVFVIITIIFIVSYLPHLVVLILTKLLQLDSKVLTKTQRTLLDVAYNCPYISTISNPLVYGFRSAEFREHCKIVFTCRRWRQRRRYRR